jgi:hypothetical protein
MNKKHIRLYVALFLVSMLISATFIVAHADSQQSTTITYTALSPDEKNHYTINIPANIEIDENGGSMKVSIEDGYEFESDYQVSVYLNSNSFSSYDSSLNNNLGSSMHNIIKLYLNGDANSSYYLGLSARAKDGSLITTVDDMVARFRADGVSKTHDGTITLSRVDSSSTNKKYKEAGAFTGTLTFNIIGSYY